jgi:hypothetical protein
MTKKYVTQKNGLKRDIYAKKAAQSALIYE